MIMEKLRTFLKNIIKLFFSLSEKLYNKIDKRFTLEIQLADHCNLNCIGCSHFSNIAEESFLDVNEFEKDCKKLAQLIKKYPRKIHLCGGEPLLHKEISKIIAITRSNFPDSIIKILTNGILLDRMDTSFWNACKQYNIIINITPYPININVKKICEISYEYDIHLESSLEDGYKMKFRKEVYDTSGSQNFKKSYKNCGRKACHQLSNNKLYVCPAIPYIKSFNKYFNKNIEVKPEDYIDIYHTNNIKEILKYFKKPLPFCKYCNVDAVDHNIKWVISKKEISEWT
jgi:MoaA/NifB/PqqE/SkfB family radical SAM enzyme